MTMSSDVCRCGHAGHEHAWNDPTVCGDLDCRCVAFISATEEMPVITPMDKYIAEMTKIKDKMQWVLQNWKWFRNYGNTELVFGWWKFVNGFNIYNEVLSTEKRKIIDAPEGITRTRRLLVEKNPDEFGPFDPTLAEEKAYKQMGIFEWVIGEKM